MNQVNIHLAPDGIYFARDAETGEGLGSFYRNDAHENWWHVVMPSGLEFQMYGPDGPEDVADRMVRRQ